MKKDIHPQYYNKAVIECACGHKKPSVPLKKISWWKFAALAILFTPEKKN